jgi:hypothetical protein
LQKSCVIFEQPRSSMDSEYRNQVHEYIVGTYVQKSITLTVSKF